MSTTSELFCHKRDSHNQQYGILRASRPASVRVRLLYGTRAAPRAVALGAGFEGSESTHRDVLPVPWWTPASVKGFGRRPLRRLGVRRGRRSKASQGGNRGEVGGPFGERAYGDLRIADGWRARRRQSATLGVFSGSADGWRFSMATMRGSEALASVAGGLATSRGRRARVPARGWRRRRSTVRGGMRGDGHELSILIRLGDGERQGRGPSNVSTMIIRPPQHGQRRAGETSSA